MRTEEYERMYKLENTYWWFQGRKEIVRQLLLYHTPLGRQSVDVLDVGCGTGLLLQEIRRYATPIGIDFSMLAMDFCTRRGIDRLVCGKVESLPFRDNRFDLVLALDLFEHINDDIALIREMYRVCRPGGNLLITVPAYQFLWSEHDEALYHYRRYSRKALRRVIESTDFEIVRFTGAITFTLPAVAAFRTLQRGIKLRHTPKTHLIRLPRPVNRFLIWLLKVESRLLRHVDFPAGVSIVALVRKPGAEDAAEKQE